MQDDPFYKAHWRHIEPERLAGYRQGFAWDSSTDALYEPLEITPGLQIADIGCGPGRIAVELARRVGPAGHVHALDINADLLAQAQANAARAGLANRLTCLHVDAQTTPLADRSMDRVTARNTLMYLDDPYAALRDVHRVLRLGGIGHAIEGDWHMMVVHPIDPGLWHAFVSAAAVACRHADMGRRLRHGFDAAGFEDIRIELHADPDIDGRLLGMIRNMARYAARSGRLVQERIDSVLQEVERALETGSYLAISPRFVVTGRKPIE